jgi:hypothetical protein
LPEGAAAEPGSTPDQQAPAPVEPAAPATGSGRFERWGPLVPVIGVIVFNLIELWPETAVVAYPDDSAMHSEMVRFATAQYRSGHFPLNAWFPFLNVGSPHFLHYQSLPAMLTGLAGLVIGPDHAYSWSLYLLVSLWPICVFASGRLLRLPRWSAAVAASLAPFVVSVPSLGYEQASYLWIGFGLWTQLWAMWTLPLAWGFTWRAVTEGRNLFPATVFVALTMSLHFMTGYLALIPTVLFMIVRPSRFRERWWRAAVVLAGSIGGAVWVIVPLLRLGRYAAINEFLQHTSHADSFGARRVMSWLVEGDIFDARRLPVITVFVGLGLLACLIRFRRDERARALLGLFVVGLVLFFGRPTLGAALRLLPGSSDLFLRRFIMGVQLAGLFLAGLGAVALARGVLLAVKRFAAPIERFATRRRVVPVRRAVGYDWSNGHDIHEQVIADNTAGRQVGALLARVRTLPPGRVYAGLPVYNWGDQFYVGQVQVLQYLTTQDTDEIGFTLRTASLMSIPEAYFDEYVPGDYRAFAVRYLILPVGRQPGVQAIKVMRRGPYVLWSVPGVSYVQVVDTIAPIALDRTDIGKQTAWWLRSPLPTEGLYPTVAYAGGTAAQPTSNGRHEPLGLAGTVLTVAPDLADGRFSATVIARRKAVVVLSASYDPGWTATVDGKPVRTQMIAPALVGVPVPPGAHVVAFTYEGAGGYPLYFGLSLLSVLAVGLFEIGRRRRRGSVVLEPPAVALEDLEVGSGPDEALDGVEHVGDNVLDRGDGGDLDDGALM